MSHMTHNPSDVRSVKIKVFHKLTKIHMNHPRVLFILHFKLNKSLKFVIFEEKSQKDREKTIKNEKIIKSYP